MPAHPAARTAVVTGGASGLGAAIVARLQADGHRVAVLDLNGGGADHSYKVDVTDAVRVGEAFDDIRRTLGPVGILVTSAGVDSFQRFTTTSFADWQRVVDVNLHGVFHTVQAALPDMIAARWGRIVNISSSSTLGGQPFMGAYVAAKSAVNGLTKSLALEFGPKGITVNAVPPGFVETPMLHAAEARGDLGGSIADHIQRTPVRRSGRPEDIAAACSFLASEDAGYITGQILPVSGGRNT